jgi:hydroxypyruvate isomerase
VNTVKRRDFLAAPAMIAGATAVGQAFGQEQVATTPSGKVRQSVMGWCFKPMDAITLATHCKQIGIEAIEGISSNDYDAVKKIGLKISLVGSHGFANGPVDTDNHGEVEKKLREGIDLAVKCGAPNVITFTGMRKAGMSDAVARKNCLDCWKRVLPYAEEKKIGIVLEHLNSEEHLDENGKVHPMKGHPGYWGDDLHLCAELVNEVGSDSFKLLFDIYHVQIMNGDLIRNINRYHDLVGHYHTAGNPGRRELDDLQEINYPPVIRAIIATGYQGYIAQEFIPTGDDPVASLQQAFDVCNI